MINQRYMMKNYTFYLVFIYAIWNMQELLDLENAFVFEW